jgi:cytoskeletal protein RodZ
MNRRSLLIGALPATLALGLLGGTAACAPAPPPADLADLRAQFDRANTDSLLAGEAATAVKPPMVAALTAVAAERTAHARALSDEITRLTDGEVPTTSATPTTTTPTTTTPTTTTPGAAPAARPSVTDVAKALRTSADGAANAAAQMSGYRAGLLGSIAASCTAAYQVALGDPGKKP